MLSAKGDVSLYYNSLYNKVLQTLIFHFFDSENRKSTCYNLFCSNGLQQSETSPFQYVERGYRDLLVLIPGWASDYRIFANLDLKFNYLTGLSTSPLTFEKSLLEALKSRNITKISLFGASMGGFVAADFAGRHPHLIDELILVGIRRKCKREEISEVRRNLKKSKTGYLYKFYKMCFSKEDKGCLDEGLFRTYSKEMHLNKLLDDLDYLENAGIKTELLTLIDKLTIIHGEYDRIAPLQEAIDIKNDLPHADFVCIKGAGHIPFLREDFADSVWPAKK